MASLAHSLTHSQWVYDNKKIVARYLRGWFTIDLISTLPVDITLYVLDDQALTRIYDLIYQ